MEEARGPSQRSVEQHQVQARAMLADLESDEGLGVTISALPVAAHQQIASGGRAGTANSKAKAKSKPKTGSVLVEAATSRAKTARQLASAKSGLDKAASLLEHLLDEEAQLYH